MKKNLLLTIIAFCFITFGFSQADCANALVLTPGTPQVGDTTGQSGSFSDSNTAPEVNPCSGSYNDLEYWFQYTAVETGETLDITISDLTNTYYGVFVIDNCPDSSPSCVASTTNGGSSADLVLTTPALTAGVVYYIVLSDWIQGPTTFTMTSAVTPPPTCLVPTDLTATGITDSSAELAWTEAGTATVWNIEIVDAGNAATGTPTATGVSNPYSAMNLTENSDYEFYVQADCGMADGVSEWAGPFAFSTICSSITPDYLADMSANAPDCWEEANSGDAASGPMDLGSGLWYASNHNGTPSNAINMWSDVRSDWIISPMFDLSTAAPSELNVYVALTESSTSGANADLGSDDNIELLMTTDGGTTWVSMQSWTQGNVPTDVGEEITYDLSAITGTVQFAFLGDEGEVNDTEDVYFHVSKFQVRETPSCIEPSALMASGETMNSVDLAWTIGDAETLWDIELVDITAGATATGTATTTGITTNPYTLTGLDANNDYEVYLRSDCGAGGTSTWIGPVAFSTACDAEVAPYSQDFENAGDIPSCWTSSSSTARVWAFATTPTFGNSYTDHTSGSGYFAFVDASTATTTTDATLTSPMVDVSGLTAPALKFYAYHFVSSGTNSNTLTVEVWDGAAWNQVYTDADGNLDEWEAIIIDLSSLTITGNIQARFIVDTESNSNFYNDIAIDDVSFDEAPSCFDPTTLAASNITFDSAELSWVEAGSATSWNIELVDVTAGNSVTGTATATGVANPYMLSGLTADNDYEFYVQADCGASGTSAWVGPFAFSTTVLCPEPSALDATNITDDSASLEWTMGATEGLWDIELVDVTAAGAATGTPTETGVSNPYMATGLTAQNDYEFYVRADCVANGTSEWVGPFAFTTACSTFTPDYTESFDTFVPDCWIEAGAGDPTTGPSDLNSGLWNHTDFVNAGGSNNSAKINLYFNNREDWLLSPSFDLSAGGYELVYTVAVTDWNNSNVPELNGMGSDDEVQVLISTDSGATWTNLATYNQSNFPSETGDEIIIDLSAYTGTAQFAIWATDGTVDDTEDYDFFVDEFKVRTPLACVSAEVDSSVVVDDCANGQFSVNVDVTTVGDATQISDGTNVYAITGTGVLVAGPYTEGTTVTLTVEHADVSCNFSLGDFTFACPPVNDDIAAAIAVVVDEGYCDGTNTNGNITASTDSGEGDGSCFLGGSNDVWFTFTVPAGVATVDVSTDFTGGTLVDSEIAVYSGVSGSLVELGCDQDSGTTILSNGSSWNSIISDLAVTVGETYYVQVSGYFGSEGSFCLDIVTNQVLGTDDFESESAFTYYPNPVKHTLTLNAQNNIEQVAMFNVLGQEVLRATPNAIDSEVDMSQLQNGAYFVKVTIANVTQTIKVIKE
ncbi:fibronectin type III domain-containing protein [Winogradskyella eckloniae]|uniref:fibronectin type III domain-containing protein n=1 Tax=Winogradskyella eckloniae TaxID=1089306 RepID=UPI001563843A|nr:fibronectin type III domain-containing protein [Winogradskyella eckloniae]NRD21155.1 fibronectin type III domain-containing protein [Winogradskyella eckloniae]